MIFEVTANSDLTEGRGSQVTKLLTEDLDKAVEEVKKWGVMGVGTGNINVLLPDQEPSKVCIWGYRQEDEEWGYGWEEEAYQLKLVMTRVNVILFKRSGKYYTEEKWLVPDGAIGPYDMERSPDFRRIDDTGPVLIPSQVPWGFPHLLVEDRG